MTDTSKKPLLVPEDKVREALEAGSARKESFEGLDYVRFSDDFHGVDRGTVLCDGRLVPSYPHIGRIFLLEEGLRKTFGDAPFVAEEKLDGYNVRVARLGGHVLPLTRGGFVCPFTEDRLSDLVDLGPLFDAHPDVVVCGEIAGPANPYIDTSPPQAPSDDVAFFAFDLMRCGELGYEPLSWRDELFARFSLPRAAFLGTFSVSDIDRIRAEVARLDAQPGGEGLVFKPKEGDGVRVKYTTPSINLYDVALDAPLLAELPGEFFVHRVLRLALAYEDMGRGDEMREVSRRLGEALVLDFLETLRDVRRGGVVSKTFTVKVHRDETVGRLLKHLNRASKKIQVNEVARRREGGYTTVTFVKVFQESTSRLKSLLDGQYVID